MTVLSFLLILPGALLLLLAVSLIRALRISPKKSEYEPAPDPRKGAA